MTDSGKIDPTTPVLIVDDNEQYAGVLRRMLSGAFGFTNVTTASSVTEGYDWIMREPDRFRLLFVDFYYPDGETGAGFIERLQAEGLLQQKVAILITSEPSAENLKRATDAGAVGMVAKPFDRNELKRQLDRAERTLFAESVDYF